MAFSSTFGFCAAAAALLLACDASVPPMDPGPHSLIDHRAWTQAEDDPYVSHQPSVIDCGPEGAFEEDRVLEIETEFCNYASLSQPTAADIEPGDWIRIDAFHDDLFAGERASAHIAVVLGENVLWDEAIPIPHTPKPYTVDVEATFEAPAGTPILLHLHNHGYNTWKLLDVVVDSESLR